MGAFTIQPRGPFSLELAAGFGFGPRDGTASLPMRLAFCTDDLQGHAAVTLTQDPDGAVHGQVEGAKDTRAVLRQVARILSLDGDGDRFAEVGRRDPVLGALQDRYPGLRPVLFHSPYEAAAWSVISARRPAAQAATTLRAIAEAHGALGAFPTPEALLDVAPMKGLPAVKVERLHAVAAAALEGALDPGALLAMDPADADARLRELPGIGPFYASLILIRAVGHHDLAVDSERFHDYRARFYGDRPWSEVVDGWRPFRTWASVLVTYAGMRGDG